MAKNNYKVPASISRSFLDHEIPLSVGGFQGKPIPLKVILFWVVSVFTMVWLLSSTLISDAAWYLVFAVGVWWLCVTALLGRYSKTKELKISSLPALAAYVQPANRRVTTRRADDPSAFYSIVGVDSVDETGMITWGDGTVGQAYLVVGSASILVFAQDKIAILDRVDAFYRKVETTAEFLWVTTKESQRIHRQLANLERRNLALENRDPELFELMQEQHSILKDFVGAKFNSIHQYLVIKADNVEALRRAHVVVRAEADESSLMIKQLTPMEGPDALELFSTMHVGAAR